MIKIRIIATNEIKEVDQNIAFDLIDRKLAKVYTEEFILPNSKNKIIDRPKQFGYKNRQIRTRVTK